MSTTKGNHHQPTFLKSWSNSKSKGAVVIDLYGVPGSGKTFLLNQLKKELGEKDFVFVEGSKMIASLVPGGLGAFVELEEAQKSYWRQLAIDTIGLSSAQSGKVAIVAGHFMFWSEEDEAGQVVWTQNDLDTFTHILYLDAAADLVVQRRRDDMERRKKEAAPFLPQLWDIVYARDLNADDA